MYTRDYRSPRVLSVRPMTRDDVQHLREKSSLPVIQRLRESHHNIARLAAAGLSNKEIAARCGFSPNRISSLRNSPAMVELIAHYQGLMTESWLESLDGFHSLTTQNMMIATRQISDTLERADDEDSPLPIRELMSIISDGADRVGHGKKSTVVNVNVDFAARLEKAISRTRLIDQKADSDAA